MDRLLKKRNNLSRRIQRIRKNTKPLGERHRLVFNRSNRYLSAQIVDDRVGRTLCSASTREKGFSAGGKNLKAARELGEVLGQRAKECGLSQLYLDRRGILYHGRIAEFARAAREQGLQF